VIAGLFAGSAVYFTGDWAIDRAGGESGMGLPITLGIVLDGIPESFVLGLTVLQDGKVSAAFLVAVFLSNLPEAIGATTGLLESGWSRLRVNLLWIGVTLVSAFSALAGYALLDGASGDTIAFVLAFAAGAILTMLADSMMPEAFANGGKLAGIVTTFGFATAFAINLLE
jgi:ZIP family zinc transporter